MKKLFADKKYCYEQLNFAREKFGNKNTTYEQLGNISKTLAFMYLYCPKDIKELVLSTIDELEKRKIMYYCGIMHNEN